MGDGSSEIPLHADVLREKAGLELGQYLGGNLGESPADIIEVVERCNDVVHGGLIRRENAALSANKAEGNFAIEQVVPEQKLDQVLQFLRYGAAAASIVHADALGEAVPRRNEACDLPGAQKGF